MTSPRLSALRVYPVASVQGAAPTRAAVEPWGPAGGRGWLEADGDGDGDGSTVTRREAPCLTRVVAVPRADGGIESRTPGADSPTVAVPAHDRTSTVRILGTAVEAAGAAPEAAAWCGAVLAADVRLFHLDDPACRRPVPPRDGSGRGNGRVGFAGSPVLPPVSTASPTKLNEAVAQGDHAGQGPLTMNRFRPNMVVDGTGPWAEDRRRVRTGGAVMRAVEPCVRRVVRTADQGDGTRGNEPSRPPPQRRGIGRGPTSGGSRSPGPAEPCVSVTRSAWWSHGRGAVVAVRRVLAVPDGRRDRVRRRPVPGGCRAACGTRTGLGGARLCG